ncbi:Hypothetical predicted protein [Podarcis lilfordi]|uniref:Uncharacterized protein n=1 Tax=Podarcis lilfordi TaxID=74358 RepID=A0AA35KCH5_9SAUR|nr:Hypothetical predicted protein [Podarcis lilfordi]
MEGVRLLRLGSCHMSLGENIPNARVRNVAAPGDAPALQGESSCKFRSRKRHTRCFTNAQNDRTEVAQGASLLEILRIPLSLSLFPDSPPFLSSPTPLSSPLQAKPGPITWYEKAPRKRSALPLQQACVRDEARRRPQLSFSPQRGEEEKERSTSP